MGDLLGLVTLTPATASLFVGLDGDFAFWTPDHGKVETAAALVPAGTTLSVDHRNQLVACAHLDPMSNDFALLADSMSVAAGPVLYGSDRLPGMRRCCLDILGRCESPQLAQQQFLDEIFPSLPIETGGTKHYQAIKKAVAIIRSRPGENMSNEALAARVGLSPSQLQRQFKEAIGVPVRRYRLWYRLFVTAAFMGYGLSLTDACLEAGFADASHFNHTFKSMLGVKPSYVLKRRDQLRILLGERCRAKVAHHLPNAAALV